MKLLEKRVTRKEKNQFKNVFECCKVHLHYNDIVLHLSNKIKISGLKTIFRIKMIRYIYFPLRNKYLKKEF